MSDASEWNVVPAHRELASAPRFVPVELVMRGPLWRRFAHTERTLWFFREESIRSSRRKLQPVRFGRGRAFFAPNPPMEQVAPPTMFCDRLHLPVEAVLP